MTLPEELDPHIERVAREMLDRLKRGALHGLARFHFQWWQSVEIKVYFDRDDTEASIEWKIRRALERECEACGILRKDTGR